jgi:hypothetical protein
LHIRALPPKRAKSCERNYLRGQNHPKAVLTDHEVELLLELRAEGYFYRVLAEKFEVSRSTVQDICAGRTRAKYG